MRKNGFNYIASTIVLAAMLCASAAAQNGSGIVLRTLDEPVTINIPEMPVTVVLSRLASSTGLNIRIDDKALELLPYGDQTRLKINANQSAPGEILTAMLRPMCLKWSVEASEIVVRPNELLLRLGRRPTFSETRALAAMSDGDIQSDQPVIEQIRKITGIENLEITFPPMDELAKSRAIKAADRKLPCNTAQYLDALCENRGLTWILTGENVLIIPEDKQVSRLLGQIISANYVSRPLNDIIMDLAHKAGIKVRMNPGVLARLETTQRENFTLHLSRVTVREAFEAISGATGLSFAPDGLAIRVAAAKNMAELTAQNAPARPDYLLVATVTGPNGESYQMLIRPDELPDDLREQLTRKKQQLIRMLIGGYDRVTEDQAKDTDTQK